MAFRQEMLTFSPWPDPSTPMVMDGVAWVLPILSDSLHVMTGLITPARSRLSHVMLRLGPYTGAIDKDRYDVSAARAVVDHYG